jgi:threonine dehydrogenase-like Zn-dependent dehydrogenase
MKALQLQAIGQVARVKVEPPAIGDGELLIRTGATTLCTSDLNDIRGNPFGIRLPVILGHEGAGTVAAVGRRVAGFDVGDRVAAHPVHPCAKCAHCRRGWGHLCASMGHFGIDRPGTFAEYFAVRADRARHIPGDVPFTVAALAEPVCVCLEALAQAGPPSAGRLLVIGDGPFGVLIARLARRLSLEKVVIAGRHDFRLAFARGVVQVNEKKIADPLARLRVEAGEVGYDAVILAVGSGQAVREGLSLLRPKGRLVVFSALPGETPVDLFDLHVRELEIVGACNDQDRLDEAVERLADPALALGDLVTHTFPIEAHREALHLAATGREEAMKVAFVFGKGG